MKSRLSPRLLRVASAAGVAWLGSSAAASAQTLTTPGNRVQDSRPGEDLPSALTPYDVRTSDLTPEQMQALESYDDRLFAVAREIQDPALRATTLNRVARSKIVARELDDAKTALVEAGQAALELPPGLVRDLRLMAITTNLVVLAHEEVVEAVPNSPRLSDDDPIRDRPLAERDAWLEQALESWRRAAELSGHITNPNYRSEQLSRVVLGQAADALKVGRDASRTATTRSDLAGQGPALFEYADRVLRQATDHAERIDRAVWTDQSMSELAVAAARAGLYSRAFAIARAIPRPNPRAEALVRVAEALAREASYAVNTTRNGLDLAYQDLQESLDEARRAAQEEVSPLLTTNRADLIHRQLTTRLAGLAEHAASVRQRADRLIETIEAERGNLPIAAALPATQDVDQVREMSRSAEELGQAVEELRGRIMAEVDKVGAAAPEAEKIKAISAAIPPEADPLLTRLRDLVDATSRGLNALGRVVAASSTYVYSDAARSVASIPLTDQRAVAARLLTESLVNVGRFADARAATRLVPDEGHRFAVLGAIAESQGRRGLADSAIAWIESEAPPQYRAALYRRLEEGILNTVDQIRTQTMNTMSP